MTDNKRFETRLAFPGSRYMYDRVTGEVVIDDGSGLTDPHRLTLDREGAGRIHENKILLPAFVGKDKDRTTSVRVGIEEGLTVLARFDMPLRGSRRTYTIHFDSRLEGE